MNKRLEVCNIEQNPVYSESLPPPPCQTAGFKYQINSNSPTHDNWTQFEIWQSIPSGSEKVADVKFYQRTGKKNGDQESPLKLPVKVYLKIQKIIIWTSISYR